MADIKIEKRNRWLPILLGVLGVVLLAWLAVDLIDSDGEPELLTADEVNFPDAHVYEERTSVDQYNANEAKTIANSKEDWTDEERLFDQSASVYINTVRKMDGTMDVEHDYSKDALIYLAESLMALSQELEYMNGAMIQKNVDLMKTNALNLTEDWTSDRHADYIREAARSSVDILKALQNEHFPNMRSQVQKVENAVDAIEADTLTLEQRDAVRNYFRVTANVLQRMQK